MKLIIAYQFSVIWFQPEVSDVSKISSMAILMAFEFVMVHSGVFMAVMPKKISLFILIPIYGLFAWGFSSTMENNDIILLYLLVVLNRMRFAFSDVSLEIRVRAVLFSVLAAILYIVLIIITLFSDGVFGELGLTQEFLKSSGYFDTLSASGEFVERPHTAISFGFFYYCFLAVLETLLLTTKTMNMTKIAIK
ncbi:hypothetical protein MPF19_17430 [Polaribacter sp. Z014]|uniref:hypothetical protein n=1 Tax=unclassified Polaribacter TaxID=196858 RepID=UPI00193B29D9|nr:MULTISPECIES: hypothetical protein [unclassified Polaribacter]MCL7765206.1 hypothetical protein [Polaribacter sp. Z014]QVY66999.1 hypothetical protein JOP69_06875 [Polaribacter sp. Q13]